MKPRFPRPLLRPLARALAALCASLAAGARAEVSLAAPFTDHAILQRDRAVPVWGRAAPGEAIEVSFAGVRAETRADAEGRWRVEIGPFAASAEGRELIAAGKNTLTLADVLVGEVWLCAGQSNMAWQLNWASGGREEIAAATDPTIRLFKVAQSSAARPAERLSGGWRPCSPETVREFSAVGYLFARQIRPETGVPVGVISCAYGGTPVESWLAEETLAREPACADAKARRERIARAWPETQARHREELAAWEKARTEAAARGAPAPGGRPRDPVGPGHPFMPAQAYNAMLHPLEGYGIRGMLWYQGESNALLANAYAAHAGEYAGLFRAFIRQCRTRWGAGDFPFLFVQLPNHGAEDPAGVSWAELRADQELALAEPATAMAVAIDLGDRADIHPKDKREISRRLARLALEHAYGRKPDADGPRATEARREGGTVLVRFARGAGLAARGGAATGLELAGPDGRFVAAEAAIEPDGAVRVRAAGVPEPSAVRYAWRNDPVASLFDAAGLPAAPFRLSVR